ncbi:hypothetical protein JD77_01343 [Micromonospora olivasterospora]|uniref:Uncharacterized protein n=1 Tax=Micromonospora olivasterospora TaxID=1880 RepID=A0A562I5V1_MICOL|nr:hypothetical protein JD77_01343 [Micromonospora olivasterospora]
MPAKSSTSSATSAAGSRHLSTSTPRMAVTPSPAATLAWTRNSGRSRRARKASTNPPTWQPSPTRYVRWLASRSSSPGSNVWCSVVRAAATDWSRLAMPYATIIAARKHQPEDTTWRG